MSLTIQDIKKAISDKKSEQADVKKARLFIRNMGKLQSDELKRLMDLRENAMNKGKWELAKKHDKEIAKIHKRLDKFGDIHYYLIRMQYENGSDILALRKMVKDRQDVIAMAGAVKDQFKTKVKAIGSRISSLFGGKANLQDEYVPELNACVQHDIVDDVSSYKLFIDPISGNDSWNIYVTANTLLEQPIYENNIIIPAGNPVVVDIPMPDVAASAARLVKVTVFANNFGNVGNSIYLARKHGKWQQIKNGEYHWSRINAPKRILN